MQYCLSSLNFGPLSHLILRDSLLNSALQKRRADEDKVTKGVTNGISSLCSNCCAPNLCIVRVGHEWEWGTDIDEVRKGGTNSAFPYTEAALPHIFMFMLSASAGKYMLNQLSSLTRGK